MSDFNLQGLVQVSLSTDIPAHKRIVDDAISEITTLRQRLAESQARVAQLEEAALNAVQLMPGGQAKADLRDAYDAEEAAAAWLLRKQAEAVEQQVKIELDHFDAYAPCLSRMESRAHRLRQQADEAERAGGEQ